MRTALAVILFIHGFAHLPGFLVPWRLATLKDLPYKTTVLNNAVEVGNAGIRVIGVLWIIAAIAMVACGVAILARMPWWQSAAWVVMPHLLGARVEICCGTLPPNISSPAAIQVTCAHGRSAQKYR